MPSNSVEIVVRTIDDATKPLANISRQLTVLQQQASSTKYPNFNGITEGAGAASKQVWNLSKMLKGLAGLTIAGFAVSQLTQYLRGLVAIADEYTIIENRLKLVTKSSAELKHVHSQLFAVAQATRGEMMPLAELYSRVARSAQRLGATQQQVMAFTKGVSQAIQVSGSTAAEASFGVIQLGQALASGTLRGDELRSVLEQMPRLATAIADGMGITVGQLRELGAQGALTSEQVFNAVLSQLPKLQAEFDQTKSTAGAAMSTVWNSVKELIGVVDNATETTSGLSDMMLQLSHTIDVYVTPAVESFFHISSRYLGALLLTVSKVVDSIGQLFVATGARLAQWLFGPLIDFTIGQLPLVGEYIRGALGFEAMDKQAEAALANVAENLRAINNTWAEVDADIAEREKRIAERVAILEGGGTLGDVGKLNVSPEQQAANAMKAYMETQKELRTDLEKTKAKITEQTQALVAMYRLSDEQLQKLGVTRGDIDKQMDRVRESWDTALQEMRDKMADARDAAERAGLTEMRITVHPVTQSALAREIDAIRRGLETLTEQALREFGEFSATLQAALAQRIIDPAEFQRLMQRYMDERLQPITISAKKIVLPPPEDLMKPFRERMAQNLQDTFADAFMNIGKGWKSTVQMFLDGFKRILAEAAAMNLARAMGLDKIAAGGTGNGIIGKVIEGLFPRTYEKPTGGDPGVDGSKTGGAATGDVGCAAKCAGEVVSAVSKTMGESVSGELKVFSSGIMGFLRTLGGGIFKFFSGTLSKLWEFIKAVVSAVRAMASGSSSSSSGGSGWWGTVASAVGAYFGGGSAGGGRIPGRAPRLVGEEGPEVIFPAGPMQVVNARQLAFAGGGASPTLNFQPRYNISITGAKDDATMFAQIAAYIERQDQKNKADIMEMMRRNGYGRMQRA